RQFPTCEKRARLKHKQGYTPMPSHKALASALADVVCFDENEARDHFKEWRDRVDVPLQLPAIEIRTLQGSLWPFVFTKEQGMYVCSMPLTDTTYEPTERPELIDLYVGCGRSECSYWMIASGDRVCSCNVTCPSFCALEQTRGGAVRRRFQTIIAVSSLLHPKIRFFCQNIMRNAPNKSNNINVRNLHAINYFQWSNFMEVVGTRVLLLLRIGASLVRKLRLFDIIRGCLVLWESGRTCEMDTGVHLKLHIYGLNSPRTKHIVDHGSEIYMEWKCACDIFVACTLHEHLLICIDGDCSVTETSLQLSRCPQRRPDVRRGKMKKSSLTPSCGSVSTAKDKFGLVWSIGHKFTQGSLEASLTGTVSFEDNPPEGERNASPMLTGLTSYIQLQFRMVDCTLTGCQVDPKSIQISPPCKLKISLEREVESREYRIWNKFGELPFAIPKSCTT
ncbi:unnamed protein product, partial [Ixodes persulcatus]